MAKSSGTTKNGTKSNPKGLTRGVIETVKNYKMTFIPGAHTISLGGPYVAKIMYRNYELGYPESSLELTVLNNGNKVEGVGDRVVFAKNGVNGTMALNKIKDKLIEWINNNTK